MKYRFPYEGTSVKCLSFCYNSTYGGWDEGEGDINKLADFLVAEANNKGGRDNISVVLINAR